MKGEYLWCCTHSSRAMKGPRRCNPISFREFPIDFDRLWLPPGIPTLDPSLLSGGDTTEPYLMRQLSQGLKATSPSRAFRMYSTKYMLPRHRYQGMSKVVIGLCAVLAPVNITAHLIFSGTSHRKDNGKAMSDCLEELLIHRISVENHANQFSAMNSATPKMGSISAWQGRPPAVEARAWRISALRSSRFT
jgi:hypothetical protein